MENLIIESKVQQNNYVENVWNKVILGYWRTDDLSDLEKLVKTVKLKAKKLYLNVTFILKVLLPMNVQISKHETTIMCSEVGRIWRFYHCLCWNL